MRPNTASTEVRHAAGRAKRGAYGSSQHAQAGRATRPRRRRPPARQAGHRGAGELGNLDPDRPAAEYGGVALSLVDALSTLAVMRNGTEFAWAVRWLSAHVRSRARPSALAALCRDAVPCGASAAAAAARRACFRSCIARQGGCRAPACGDRPVKCACGWRRDAAGSLASCAPSG
jgi:hypothetical protein